MSTVIGIACIIIIIVLVFSLIGGLIKPSHFDKKQVDGTIKKASRLRIFVTQSMLIFVFTIVSIVCLVPSEDKPEVENVTGVAETQAQIVETASKPVEPVKITKAEKDSAAMYKGISDRTAYAKKSYAEARSEFEKGNHKKSKKILDNVPSIQGVGEVNIMFGSDPILKDAWNTQMKLNGLDADIYLKEKEIEYTSKHWIRYPARSLERMFEIIIIDWYKSDVLMNEGSVFDYSFIRRGLRKSIVKNIEFSNGKLSISLRADPDDFVDLNYRERSIDYKHPLKFMREFRSLLIAMWRSKWEYNIEKYSRVAEIEFSFYYAGSRSGTEQIIAKFGLTRNAVQSTSFAKLRHRDGTFQDFIKQKGTYWLHQAIPDMGTSCSPIK